MEKCDLSTEPNSFDRTWLHPPIPIGWRLAAMPKPENSGNAHKGKPVVGLAGLAGRWPQWSDAVMQAAHLGDSMLAANRLARNAHAVNNFSQKMHEYTAGTVCGAGLSTPYSAQEPRRSRKRPRLFVAAPGLRQPTQRPAASPASRANTWETDGNR